MARASLKDRLDAVEIAHARVTAAYALLAEEKKALEADVKLLKDRLMKVEMHVGFFVADNTKEGVRQTLDAWSRITRPVK